MDPDDDPGGEVPLAEVKYWRYMQFWRLFLFHYA